MPPIMCTIIRAQLHIGSISTMIFQLHIPERIIKRKINKTDHRYAKGPFIL